MDEILPMAAVERRAIEHALRATKGNVPAAAKKLRLGQAAIYRKIKSYKIKVKSKPRHWVMSWRTQGD